MTAITMEVEGVRLEGELLETPPARALAKRLPLEIRVERWGEEYYGDLGDPLGAFDGHRVEQMEVGDLAYWEPGNALCLFFGPTPASLGPEPQAASPVHPLGRLRGDWAALRALGQRVTARVTARAG